MSPTGHGNTSVLKEKSPLLEVLRAVVKHFSPMHVHKSHFWPISTEQGRYFFHCGCMPSTGAIRWGDISFRTRPRPPTEPPILTRRNRHQQPGGADVMRAEGLGGHSTAAVRAAEPESTRAPSPTRLEATAWPAGAAGPGQHRKRRWCGGRRRDRRAWPRCRRATAGPGQASRRRVQPHISDTEPPEWRAWLRRLWAAAGPGRASRRGAERSEDA